MRKCLTECIRHVSHNAASTKINKVRLWQPRAYSTSTTHGHSWSTPLARQLAEAIATTGPVPVATFMRQCLTSDLGGYYTTRTPSEKDQFGTKGDFVTSPEISQIFGELIGVWIVAEWISQGKKSKGVYLMEVGPGRGTLMDDVLRTIKKFPELLNALDNIYLVEASAGLRKAQHKLLCGENALERNDIGFRSTSKHSEKLEIVWAEDVRFVPKQADQTPFILAHEFFDALPVHVFRSVPPSNVQEDSTIQTPTGPIPAPKRSSAALQHQWRELLVSAKPPHRLKEGEAEFEMSIAKAATPHSMYLPETSDRYKALKATSDATIEISPESLAYVRDFAERLGGAEPKLPKKGAKNATPFLRKEPSGAALIIDYGTPANIPTDSLRGIRAHKRVSPFECPGATDVSADVDFLGLAEAAIGASPGVEVHGPVDQARFLTAMGIKERAAQLIKQAVDRERAGSTGQDKSELTDLVTRIESGWKRLIDTSPQGMGRLYQVMAILPYLGTQEKPRRPVGFGGDIVT